MLIAFPLWASVLLILLAVLSGVGVGLRLDRRSVSLTSGNALQLYPGIRWFLGILVMILITTGILLRNQRLSLLLPLPVQYWGPTVVLSFFIVALGLFNAFCVTVAFREQHAERKKLLVAGVIFTLALGYVQIHYPRPLAPALVHELAPDGSILQSSDASCVPASAANIARALGVVVTESYAARLMNTTRMFGTNIPQVVVGMRALGISCVAVDSATANLEDVVLPAILIVDHPDLGRESHAVAVMARNGSNHEVIDPLVGRETWGTKKMHEVWHGLAVSCKRQEG